MEESYISGAGSPLSADASITSTGTVKEQPGSQSSPTSVSPQKRSPVKLPSSPTVKISKSPISVFKSERAEGVAESEVSSTELMTGTVPESDSLPFGSQKVDIDLTAEDEMDVDQSEENEDQIDEIDIKKTTEIFEQYEEINPPPEIEELSTSADEVQVNQSIKQEVVEESFSAPPEPVRQLEIPVQPDAREEKVVFSFHECDIRFFSCVINCCYI